jgi:DNA-directed RNA polymerase subunit E'/Rpb7
VEQTLKLRLRQEVEGRCLGASGYVVTVTEVVSVGVGRIEDATGNAVYSIAFTAVVFKPFTGEVLDAVVSTVKETGIFASAGPLNLYISTSGMKDMAYDKAAAVPCFKSPRGDLKANTHIRARIVGVRVDVSEIVSSHFPKAYALSWRKHTLSFCSLHTPDRRHHRSSLLGRLLMSFLGSSDTHQPYTCQRERTNNRKEEEGNKLAPLPLLWEGQVKRVVFLSRRNGVQQRRRWRRLDHETEQDQTKRGKRDDNGSNGGGDRASSSDSEGEQWRGAALDAAKRRCDRR